MHTITLVHIILVGSTQSSNLNHTISVQKGLEILNVLKIYHLGAKVENWAEATHELDKNACENGQFYSFLWPIPNILTTNMNKIPIFIHNFHNFPVK
jgi:hypothetical protein